MKVHQTTPCGLRWLDTSRRLHRGISKHFSIGSCVYAAGASLASEDRLKNSL